MLNVLFFFTKCQWTFFFIYANFGKKFKQKQTEKLQMYTVSHRYIHICMYIYWIHKWFTWSLVRIKKCKIVLINVRHDSIHAYLKIHSCFFLILLCVQKATESLLIFNYFFSFSFFLLLLFFSFIYKMTFNQ